MASPAMVPAQGGPGATAQGQGPAGTAPQGDPKEAIDRFRSLAQMVQFLGRQYPEGNAEASQILPMIEKWMSRVVGNVNRVPNQQAPPNVG